MGGLRRKMVTMGMAVEHPRALERLERVDGQPLGYPNCWDMLRLELIIWAIRRREDGRANDQLIGHLGRSKIWRNVGGKGQVQKPEVLLFRGMGAKEDLFEVVQPAR